MSLTITTIYFGKVKKKKVDQKFYFSSWPNINDFPEYEEINLEGEK